MSKTLSERNNICFHIEYHTSYETTDTNVKIDLLSTSSLSRRGFLQACLEWNQILRCVHVFRGRQVCSDNFVGEILSYDLKTMFFLLNLPWESLMEKCAIQAQHHIQKVAPFYYF